MTVSDVLMSPPLVGLERAEAEGWAEIQTNASQEFREAFGVQVRSLQGAIAAVAPLTDMVAINRVWLPGADPEITGELVDEIVRVYSEAGSPRVLIHCPDWASPVSGSELFTSRGFREARSMVKVARRASEAVSFSSPLVIREIAVADTLLFGQIAARGNEVPSNMISGFNSTVGLPGWRHYLAFDDDEPVAAAALRTIGDVAWCCFGGTLPSHRQHGAQSALLAQRVRDAAAAGCTWVSCETLSETSDDPVQSLRNMQRMGFHVAYQRQTYIKDLSP